MPEVLEADAEGRNRYVLFAGVQGRLLGACTMVIWFSSYRQSQPETTGYAVKYAVNAFSFPG
jgi:hypothetical protein